MTVVREVSDKEINQNNQIVDLQMKLEFTQLELEKYEKIANSYGCKTPGELSVFIGDTVWRLVGLEK